MSNTETIADSMQNWAQKVADTSQTRKILGEQTERVWRAEDEIMSGMHDYFESWFDRRHEAAQAAMDFGKMLSHGADQAELAKAWSTLSANAMKRFADDAQAQMAFLQKMAATVTSNGTLGMPMMMAAKQDGDGETSRSVQKTASGKGEKSSSDGKARTEEKS